MRVKGKNRAATWQHRVVAARPGAQKVCTPHKASEWRLSPVRMRFIANWPKGEKGSDASRLRGFFYIGVNRLELNAQSAEDIVLSPRDTVTCHEFRDDPREFDCNSTYRMYTLSGGQN